MEIQGQNEKQDQTPQPFSEKNVTQTNKLTQDCQSNWW